LYVSTRYKLFRVTFVGGNPDWAYTKVKDFGFVPRTVKNVFIKDAGEVLCGLSYDRRIRLFDGSEDRIISDKISKDNGQCDFALDKISYAGSGLVYCFAEYDMNEQIYRLCVTIGSNSTNTSHFINFDGGEMLFFPWSNTPYNTMCMAESGNRTYLMAFDRNGYVHAMNSGNLDSGVRVITPIYDSPIIFDKSPSQLSKGYKNDLFFSATSSGDLYYQDRVDFNDSFETRKVIALVDTNGILKYEQIDVPETFNAYQYRLTSSSGDVEPWKLLRRDMFLAGKGVGKNP